MGITLQRFVAIPERWEILEEHIHRELLENCKNPDQDLLDCQAPNEMAAGHSLKMAIGTLNPFRMTNPPADVLENALHQSHHDGRQWAHNSKICSVSYTPRTVAVHCT